MLGQLRVSSLALEGKNVEVDVRSLVAEQRLQVRLADKLVLHATVKASDLAAVLAKKVDKLKDVEVDINPAGVQIKGSIPLAGRTVEVNIEGAVTAQRWWTVFSYAAGPDPQCGLGTVAYCRPV